MNILLAVVVAILLVLVVLLALVLARKGQKPNPTPVDAGAVATPAAITLPVQAEERRNDNVAKFQPPAVSQQTQDQVQRYLDQAKAKAREIIIEARDEAIKVRSGADNESAKIRSEVSSLEKKVADKLTQVDIKEKELDDKSQKLTLTKEEIAKDKQKLDGLVLEAQEKLQNVSGLTKEEAKNHLLASLDKELKQEKGKRIKQNEEEIKNESDKLARDILVTAMRRGATDIVVEHTVSKVRLPDEDIKGRIIGKEGRNIRTFEELTGVDLDMDSSPGDIMISSFDPVRREIARLAMEKLIADGRIQPARIEEIVLATQKDMDQLLFKEGENLCHRLGVYNLPREVVSVLGRLKFRFSYGQNMIEHTIEETRIGVSIAQEIKADVEVVKMSCLLHDIGKVIADEEGTHIQIGVDFLRKFKIAESAINCVAEHHEDKPFSSVESAVVNLADHISGARPGARSEDYESYKKRMEDLEQAATSFDGVEKAYAISAGREVRVIVKPDRVDDSTASILAREIAKKIELEQSYPGVVKVTVIREIRISETAK
ncbi:ribonuclease Y [candidate division WWE3 bacterium CG08_land_8_20_14_0_20_41_10]|uniref:Ribonuclease Y n=1 Tax=candidate division WWE3 bacterium CG08_land_8_20_14_0_20_41_10 TaxID=1975085 RepID=A0A2H0XBI3_UNCKA|nr:MAG: ribonuclease Y [candidate division WWE3 bacterium CG08_land_8_20_14_0_20_41_10]